MIIQATSQKTITGPARALLAISAVLLIIAFFLSWVKWDNTAVTGAAMASGDFFSISEKQFGLANPFPALGILMAGLWIVPVFALITLILTVSGKRFGLLPLITGVLVLSLVTMYLLFSRTLLDLGINYSLQPGIYLSAVAGTGLVLSGTRLWLAKILFLVAGPLITYLAFSLATKHIEGQEYDDTAGQPSAYTMTADQILGEFRKSDSAANAKYREQIITVNGNISAIEFPTDSTATIKFADSTGSYAIFPFGKNAISELKALKEADPVSIKASCSGGVYSDILETEVITFKRSTLIKK